jgi:cell division protein FtsW (lipid II flippase)
MRFGLLLTLTAMILVALSFCFSGLDGVHRWLVFGGVRLHAAAIAIPAFLIGFRNADREIGSRMVWLLSLTVGALLMIQPDAAQATGFTLAAVTLFLVKRRRLGVMEWLGVISLCGFLIATWHRIDSLGAVPHVEGIVGLAATLSPMLAVAAVASLALVVLPFVIVSKYCGDPNDCATALGLGFYFVGVLLATLSGRFPVPLLGYGASAIIGYFVALGWLLRMVSKLNETLGGKGSEVTIDVLCKW